MAYTHTHIKCGYTQSGERVIQVRDDAAPPPFLRLAHIIRPADVLCYIGSQELEIVARQGSYLATGSRRMINLEAFSVS